MPSSDSESHSDSTGQKERKVSKWKSAAKGIRYREHPSRKHGKRADRYYTLIYRRSGKLFEEAMGWASDGVTLDKCEKRLVTLRENWRSGEGPQTLAKMRQAAEEAQTVAETAKEEARQRLITVNDYFEQHYQPQTKRTLKQSSWDKEASLFKFWINPVVGKHPLVEVGFIQWDALLKRMDKSGLSQRTKEYAAGVLRRVLRHAQDRGLEVNIPTARQIGASAPKDNRRLRVLTTAESETILTELETRDVPAWRVTKFAMLTGCRASEAFNLRWRDVDLIAGQLRFMDTKNKEPRTLFLSQALLELLRGFGPGDPDAVVFLRADGKPHVEAPHHFKEVVQEQKMNEGRGHRDRISFHSIRHTVATTLAGILDIRSLMDVMGWKQVAMAARYVHSNESGKRAAMAVLEKAIVNSKKENIIPFSKAQA